MTLARSITPCALALTSLLLPAGCGDAPPAPGVAGAPNAQAPTGAARRFASATRGFSMAFPDTWEVRENVENLAMLGMSPLEGEEDPVAESVTVAMDTQPANMNHNEFYRTGMRLMRENLKEFNLLEESATAIFKYPAARLDFTQVQEGHRLRCVSFIMLIDGRGCSITCAAIEDEWPRWEPTLLTIARSFQQP